MSAVRTIWAVYEQGASHPIDHLEFDTEAEALERASQYAAVFDEPYEARATEIPVKYLITSTRTDDAYRGFGARWIDDPDLAPFRFVEVPAEHVLWMAGRLGSGGCLFGSKSDPFETLDEAKADARELAALGLAPRR